MLFGPAPLHCHEAAMTSTLGTGYSDLKEKQKKEATNVMPKIRSLCAYCGASQRVDPLYLDIAKALGREAALRGIELIFGGGRVGMMGAVADGAIAEGGSVVGIIPEHLESVEVGHQGVTRLEVVPSMHVRKMRMFELSDAFCILPGGLGTLDETFEILTWRQLGLHDKPVVVLDTLNYWQPLKALIEHQVKVGFVKPEHAEMLTYVSDLETLFETLEAEPRSRIEGESERF